MLLVSIAWITSSNCFSKELPLIPVLNCYMFWEKNIRDFCLLAVSCPYYEGLGLRDVVQRPLPMTRPRQTHSPQQVDDLFHADTPSNRSCLGVVRFEKVLPHQSQDQTLQEKRSITQPVC